MNLRINDENRSKYKVPVCFINFGIVQSLRRNKIFMIPPIKFTISTHVNYFFCLHNGKKEITKKKKTPTTLLCKINKSRKRAAKTGNKLSFSFSFYKSHLSRRIVKTQLNLTRLTIFERAVCLHSPFLYGHHHLTST